MRKRTWRSTAFCLLMAVGLVLSFHLCRYTLLDLHFMKEWPELMYKVGIVLMAAAVIGNAPYTCLGIGPGYLAAFFIGYIFQFDYGMSNNSHWWLWTLAWLAFIVIGFIADCIYSNREKRGFTR